MSSGPKLGPAMATLLDTLPVLEGALCRGEHDLFDPPDLGEQPDLVAHRRAAALVLCGRCPEQQRCATAAPSTPAAIRGAAGQIWAGVVIEPGKRRTTTTNGEAA